MVVVIKMEDYLKSIWYDPKHPASFTGPSKLYKAVRQEGKYKITLKKIKDWLRNVDAYSLQETARRKFPRARVVVEGLDSMFDVDLADVQNLAKYNDQYRYLIIMIDIFSRFLWVVPLKDKKGASLVKGLSGIFEKGRKPQTLRSDRGGKEISKKGKYSHASDTQRNQGKLCREGHTDIT